ncbi:MAG: c-type cytochrome biogenesis protein CcsB [Pseudomonadota bacterium]
MDWLLKLSFLGYLAGSAGFAAYFATNRQAVFRAGQGLFGAGAALHTAFVLWAWAGAGYPPVNGLKETLFFAAWAMALAFELVDLRYGLRVLGVVAGPAVIALMAAGFLVPGTAPADPQLLGGVWMLTHVMSLFFGYAALFLAAGAGALYLLQERSIKRKSHGFFFRRLPSLDNLDRMNHGCLAVGFTLLTLGLITGAVYAQAVWGRWWSWDPKEVWSAITWLTYAALLHERLAVGWRGRRAAVLSILGLVLILFTFLGVNLLLEGHHGPFTRI